MAVNKFVFRSYPDFSTKVILLIVSLVLCLFISYIIPGWDYLNIHQDNLENYFGKYIPIGILFFFYLTLFIILYIVLLNRFSKNFYISKTDKDQLTVYTGNQNEVFIKKEDLQFTTEKTFSIKSILNTNLRKHPKGISVKSFKQYIKDTSTEEYHHLGNSFSGSILPMSIVYTSLVVGFMIYIVYAIVLYKILTPHMEAFQVLFRAKSPLLLIVISLPLLGVFFLVMYYLYQQTILRKHLIKIDWSENQVMTSTGNKKYIFKKNEIKASVFYINRFTHLSKWLIIEQKNGTRYVILCEDEDNNAYQEFINSYVKYFDIDIENAKSTIGSSTSLLMKKKYTHE